MMCSSARTTRTSDQKAFISTLIIWKLSGHSHCSIAQIVCIGEWASDRLAGCESQLPENDTPEVHSVYFAQHQPHHGASASIHTRALSEYERSLDQIEPCLATRAWCRGGGSLHQPGEMREAAYQRGCKKENQCKVHRKVPSKKAESKQPARHPTH